MRLVLLKSFLDFIGSDEDSHLSQRQKRELAAFAKDFCTRVVDEAGSSIKKLRFHRDAARADWEPVAHAA